MSGVVLHLGDVIDVVRTMPDASFDALLSDVPYGLGSREPSPREIADYVLGESSLDMGGDFMSKDWQIPPVAFWREAYRVLKPGATLLVFGGSRTQDLIGIGLRAAGFVIRDCVQWWYFSGFPKSLAIDKAIDARNGDERPVVGAHPNPQSTRAKIAMGDGWQDAPDLTSAASAASAAWSGHGTALKPAYEPCILAMKPLDGTFANNALTHGVAGINVDGCRVGYSGEGDKAAAAAAAAQRACRDQNDGRTAYGDFNNGEASLPGFYAKQDLGRWPANVIIDDGIAALLDAQSGDRPGMSGGGVHRDDYGGGMFGAIDSGHLARNDSGGASRFLYVAKASRAERDFGCEHLSRRTAGEATDREDDSAGLTPRAGAGRTGGARNFHPCVKPISLTRYLATLALPPKRPSAPRRILIPYAGSGSEMIGAVRAGWEEVVGIERDPEYRQIALARLGRWSVVPAHLDESEVMAAAEVADARQTSLFGEKESA